MSRSPHGAARLRRVLSAALGTLFLVALLIWGPIEVREANAERGWPVWGHPLARVAGVVLIMAGAGLVGYSMALMTRLGAGTPVPTDPPTRLVVQGAFRWSRNPIYLGYAVVLLGEALLFGEAALYLYWVGALVFFHATVVGYEEPRLRRRFGEEYERYARRVPRWLGRFSRPSKPAGAPPPPGPGR